MRLVEGQPATYTLRGEQFEASSSAWECPDTGERYTSPDQDVAFIAQLHRAWRERHGIAKEALRQRRQALGLSAAQASALLGFSKRKYHAFEETDRLPSDSNAILLKQLLDEDALGSLLRAAQPRLTNDVKRLLKMYLAQRSQLILPNRSFSLTNHEPGEWSNKLRAEGLLAFANEQSVQGGQAVFNLATDTPFMLA